MLSTNDFAVLSVEELEQVSGGYLIFMSGHEEWPTPPYIMESYSPIVQNAIRDAMHYRVMP